MSISKSSVILICAFILIIATNKYFDIHSGIESGVSDMATYQKIALSAPSLPDKPSLHFAQRFLIPWLTGIYSKGLGISIYSGFLTLTFLLCLSTLFVLNQIGVHLKLKPRYRFILLSLYIFNPFTIRYYLAYPAMITDCAFRLGFSLVILFLLKKRLLPLLASLAFCMVSRQTALLLIPSTALWVSFGELWRNNSVKIRGLHAACVIAVCIFYYLLTDSLASTLCSSGRDPLLRIDLFSWFQNSCTNSAQLFAYIKHLIKSNYPLIFFELPIIAFFIRSNRSSIFANKNSIFLLIFTLSIIAQPILYGPIQTGGNGPRLFSLALPALFAAICYFQSKTQDLSISRLCFILPIIIISSFHPLWSTAPTFPVFYYPIAYYIFALPISKTLFKKNCEIRL